MEITRRTWTLDRPDAGNAIDLGLATALRDAAMDAIADPGCAAIVLAASGRGRRGAQPGGGAVVGARGFAHEFGVSNLIMRVQGLRLELGSADRLAESVLSAPSCLPVSGRSR